MADEDANFVILPEIDELRGFSIRFEKIGGAYGKAEILPFIVTADGHGKPALPEGWTQTVGADGIVQAAPISDVAVNNTAYKTVSAQLVSSLSPLTDAQGVRMDPGSLTQDGATGGYVQDGNSKRKSIPDLEPETSLWQAPRESSFISRRIPLTELFSPWISPFLRMPDAGGAPGLRSCR